MHRVGTRPYPRTSTCQSNFKGVRNRCRTGGVVGISAASPRSSVGLDRGSEEHRSARGGVVGADGAGRLTGETMCLGGDASSAGMAGGGIDDARRMPPRTSAPPPGTPPQYGDDGDRARSMASVSWEAISTKYLPTRCGSCQLSAISARNGDGRSLNMRTSSECV